MATVPRVSVPQTEIANAPGGGRGSLALRSIGDIGAAFGEDQAEVEKRTGVQIQKTGELLSQAATNIKNRADAVARAGDFETYRAQLRDNFLAEERDGSNFATVESVRDFSTKANEAMEQILENHAGSTMSRLTLQEMLVSERGKFSNAAVSRSIQTQQNLVDNQIGDYVTEHTSIVTEAPETLPDQLVDFETRLKNYEGTMSPGQIEQRRRAGQEQMLSGALESILTLGNTTQATKILDESSKMLSPEAVRRFRNKIITLDTQINKQKSETAAALKTLESLGVPKSVLADPRVALALVGVNLPAGAQQHPNFQQQVGDGILALEQAQGAPATPKQRMEVFNAIVTKNKTDDPDPLFGKSEKGLARQHVVDLAPKFASGQISDYEKRVFFQAVAAITQPDVVTGQPGVLSADAVTALAMGGVDASRLNEPEYLEQLMARPGSVGLGQTARGAHPNTSAAPSRGEEIGSFEAEAQEITNQALERETQSRAAGQSFDALTAHERSTRETGMISTSERAKEPPITLFSAASLLTGPVSGLQSAAAGTAGIGDIFPADKVRQARRFMESFKHDFVTVLQNNPKYPEGERQAILKSLDIESSMFASPRAFQQDLIGLDDFMAVREQNARNTVQSGKVSKDVRAAALNILNAIGNARKIIGVPPLMKDIGTAREALRSGLLKSGQQFRIPDGTVIRVK